MGIPCEIFIIWCGGSKESAKALRIRAGALLRWLMKAFRASKAIPPCMPGASSCRYKKPNSEYVITSDSIRRAGPMCPAAGTHPPRECGSLDFARDDKVIVGSGYV